MHDTLDMRRSEPFLLAGAPSDALKRLARLVVVLAALGVVAYAAVTAWHVVTELRAVRLSELAHALDSVSVGDAILCLVGYRLGSELLRALADRRRNPA